MRKNSFEKLAITGKIEGTKARGRQRLKYLDSLCTALKDKMDPVKLIAATEDRDKWRLVIANVVQDDTAP